MPIVTISMFILQLTIFYSSSSPKAWKTYGYQHPGRISWFTPLTYSVFHLDSFHIWSNMIIFLVSGTIIELTEAGLRLAIVLLISTPMAAMGHGLVSSSLVVGASGFVYATITYQLALALKNWREMRVRRDASAIITFRSIVSSVYTRLLIGVVLLTSEIGFSNARTNTSHGGHAFGALGGLVVGVVVGSNVRIDMLEIVLPALGLLAYIVSAMAISAASGQILCLVYFVVFLPILIWYVLQEWLQWNETWYMGLTYDPPRIVVRRRVKKTVEFFRSNL